MKIKNTDLLTRLLDDDFDDFFEEEQHKKQRRNRAMRTIERGDAKKQSKRHIQQARSAKQRESYELTEQ